MWPYEIFNQYSALINEFNSERNSREEKKRKIFISRKYCEDENKEEERKQFFEGIIKEISEDKVLLCDRNTESCSAFLGYKFEIEMPSKAAKDDINKKILVNIMESYIVICDITPDKNINFNANVMAELGVALAWKTAEQVIILWDTSECRKIDPALLPFNIRNYFVNNANFNNKDEIIEIIRSRVRDIKHEKTIIIRNIVSKLDGNSLQVLEGKKGLSFGGQEVGEHTIRHLLNLGLLKTDIFPLNSPDFTRTYTYQFTELARFVMHKLKTRGIFDQRFADFMHIYWWSGHETHEEYKSKLGDFFMDYRIPWLECDSILQNLLKVEITPRSKDGNMWPVFDHFCKRKSFDDIQKNLVNHWNAQVDSLIKSDNNKIGMTDKNY